VEDSCSDVAGENYCLSASACGLQGARICYGVKERSEASPADQEAASSFPEMKFAAS